MVVWISFPSSRPRMAAQDVPVQWSKPRIVCSRLEYWGWSHNGPSQMDPNHPCHIPGDQECSCREHSQLRARLVTNYPSFSP